jgi:hypothetical protein
MTLFVDTILMASLRELRSAAAWAPGAHPLPTAA